MVISSYMGYSMVISSYVRYSVVISGRCWMDDAFNKHFYDVCGEKRD